MFGPIYLLKVLHYDHLGLAFRFFFDNFLEAQNCFPIGDLTGRKTSKALAIMKIVDFGQCHP
jgi:hypothetical protein